MQLHESVNITNALQELTSRIVDNFFKDLDRYQCERHTSVYHLQSMKDEIPSCLRPALENVTIKYISYVEERNKPGCGSYSKRDHTIRIYFSRDHFAMYSKWDSEMGNESSLILIHELRHAYNEFISDSKKKTVKPDPPGSSDYDEKFDLYLNSKEEISARFESATVDLKGNLKWCIDRNILTLEKIKSIVYNAGVAHSLVQPYVNSETSRIYYKRALQYVHSLLHSAHKKYSAADKKYNANIKNHENKTNSKMLSLKDKYDSIKAEYESKLLLLNKQLEKKIISSRRANFTIYTEREEYKKIHDEMYRTFKWDDVTENNKLKTISKKINRITKNKQKTDNDIIELTNQIQYLKDNPPRKR